MRKPGQTQIALLLSRAMRCVVNLRLQSCFTIARAGPHSVIRVRHGRRVESIPWNCEGDSTYEAEHLASRTFRGGRTYGTDVDDVDAGGCGGRFAVATDRAPVGARDRQDGFGEGPLVCTGVQWWIGSEEIRRHVASLEAKLHHRAKELCREGSSGWFGLHLHGRCEERRGREPAFTLVQPRNDFGFDRFVSRQLLDRDH